VVCQRLAEVMPSVGDWAGSEPRVVFDWSCWKVVDLSTCFVSWFAGWLTDV
jgi:hypothetical protein